MKKLTFIYFLVCSITFAYAQNDPTADRWDDNGNNTDIAVPGEIGVTKTAINGKERIVKFEITDDDNFISIDNLTSMGSEFYPALVGQVDADSDHPNALHLIGSIDPEADGEGARSNGAIMTFQTRRSNNGTIPAPTHVINANLFRWVNNSTIHMLMSPSGDLGIGTSNPSTRLHVNGDVRFQNLASGTAANMLATDANGNVIEATIPTFSGDDDWYISGTTTAPTNINDDIFTKGAVGIGGNPIKSFTPSGGSSVNINFSVLGNALVSGGQWYTSDERLKRDITPINQESNEVLMNIKGYSYFFKDVEGLNLPQNKQYGFLAQELEKSIDGMVVDVDGDIELKIVEKSYILPFLVEGHKYQDELIKSQNEKINELSSEIADLKGLVQDLLQKNNTSIDEAIKDELIVFPNPTTGILTVKIPSEFNSNNVVLIYDLSGRLKKEIKVIDNNNKVNIDISDQLTGQYNVILMNNGEIVEFKSIIKE